MKKGYCFAIVVVSVVALIGLFGFNKADDRMFQIVRNLDIFNAVYKELDMLYVDTIDPKKVIEAGIDAMLEETDPYTEYYPEDDKTLKEMTTGKFGGIGAVIRYYAARKRVVVVEPSEGNPAAMAGIKAGDVIMEVNGEEMVQGEQNAQDFTTFVTSHLRGDPGTTCKIKVERMGADSVYVPLEFQLTRGSIKTNPVPFHTLLHDSIGYINMSTFAIENCSKEAKKALIELKQKGAAKMILDLRGNGGGLLNEAVNVVNLFVPKGQEIVRTKGKVKQMEMTYRTMSEPVDLNIPLVVLVNGATASASEIVSGALQDLDRAVVVGTRTYGKGLVQTPRELPYNSSMKITTAKYYIPSGRCIQAIDYSKKSVDGSVNRIPDSLTTVYHTAAGREVRDGGGITPDETVDGKDAPNILFYLINGDEIFDYATSYCARHASIDSPDKFALTDNDYAEFGKMLENRNFSYDRQSGSLLKRLKEMAEFEGYLDNASAEFEALEKKLQHNLDMELEKFKVEIKQALAEEIVKRYYYEKGSIEYLLRDDKDVEKAMVILSDPTEYARLLSVLPL
ncbi:MAG: S41 family peptidase [Bacteroidales bacterium]|nr:S41 family peptidase [Bacteroidales bacterium]